jgi:carbonic anhydrase
MIKTPAILSLLSLGLLCATGAHAAPDASCCAAMAAGKDAPDIVIPASEVIPDTILTREAQSQLTPDAVLSILMEGNQEYIADNLTVRNNTQRMRDSALGQYPMAVVLSCLDSRVPVEDVFHRGIGDLFVARVAGNVVNEDILGSMEFACKVSGTKLVLVLGHEHCGAIRSAIQGVELGNITALLAKIQPAVKEAESGFKGDATASNPKFVQAVCDDNVLLAVQQIRNQSPILKQMESDGEIKIVGGIYHLESGKVELLD